MPEDDIEAIEREAVLSWIQNGSARLCDRCGRAYVPSRTSDPDLCGSCVPLRNIPMRTEEEVPESKAEKKCIVCLSFFEPTSSRQVYCSPKCRKNANYRKKAWGPEYEEKLGDRAEDPNFKRVCEVCEGSLDGMRKDARYCSDNCRVKAHMKRG